MHRDIKSANIFLFKPKDYIQQIKINRRNKSYKSINTAEMEDGMFLY